MRLPLPKIDPLYSICALCLGASFGISLFFHGTDNALYGPAMVLAFTAVFLLLQKTIRTGALPSTLPLSLLAIVGFGTYALISVSWSTVPFVSLFFAFILAFIPLTAAAIFLAPQQEKAVAHVAVVMGFALFCLMTSTVIQLFFFRDAFNPRIHEPLLDPNNLAVLVNLGLLPALAFYLAATRKLYVAAGFIVVSLFFLALTATQSRSGIIAFGVAATILVPVLWRADAKPLLKSAMIVPVMLFIVFLVDKLSAGRLGSNLEGVLKIDSLVSVADRVSLWESSWQMFLAHPWGGTGLATFYFYYPEFRQRTDSSDGYFAHMDPLQFALEMGIMAPILFYGALILILIRTIAACLKALPAQRARIMGIFCALLTTALHCHATFCLYLPAITMAVGVFLGLWLVETQRALSSPTSPLILKPHIRRISLIALIVLCGLSIAWTVRAAAGIEIGNRVERAVAENNREKSLDLIKKEKVVSPKNYSRPYEQEARLYFNRLRTEKNSLSDAERRDLYKQAYEATEHALDRNPAQSGLHNLLALIVYIGSTFDESANPEKAAVERRKAQEILENLLKRDPLYMDARIGLARMYQQQGDIKRAIALLDEGLPWPRPKGTPDLAYITTTAQIKLQAGDQAGYDFLMNVAKDRARRYERAMKRSTAEE